MENEHTAPQKFKLKTLIGLVVVHLLAGLACVPAFFSWWGVGLFFLMWWLTASLGISLSFHRLLTHRSYKPKRWLRNLLTIFGCLTLEMGPIRWSATHRQHHRESDHEADPHSPLVSFWWGHLTWLLFERPPGKDPVAIKKLVSDLYDDRALQFMERNFVWFWVGFALTSFGVGYLLGGFSLGMSLMVWGSFLRTVVVWHCTWFVNSATHLWGYRNYATADDSRNSWWVALLTFGEGWHNNHHAEQGSARFGQRWWELDPTYWALCVFHRLGWIEKISLAAPWSPQAADSPRFRGKVEAASRALKSALRHPETSQAVD